VFIDVGAFAVGGNGSGIRTDSFHTYYPQYKNTLSGQWVFMGDPLSTAINSLGEPADTSTSRELTTDTINSSGRPSLIVNSIGLTVGRQVTDHFGVEALIEFLPRPGPDLIDVELAGDGIGAAVALAMARQGPQRYAKVTVANVPRPGAPLPPSFLPETFGEHLIRAWHTVRDDAIYGAWCVRDAEKPHRFGSTLDIDGIHRRTVDALKGASALDLCKAALAAPPTVPSNVTVLPGMTPLAERMI